MSIDEKYQQFCRMSSDINEHLPVLRRYAQNCDTVVEFGVRGVVSTWAFLAARPKRLISVDVVHPSRVGGDLRDVVAFAFAAKVEFQFIEASDLEITIPECDLLFIDTWHVYEQLKAELERHASKVNNFIILHDTNTFGNVGESAGHRGLRPAIELFLGSPEGLHWTVVEELYNNHGLTILGRK